MKLSVTHSVLGFGVLTDEHAASSYGQPVFYAAKDGEVYGPGDCPGFLSRAKGVIYTDDEQAWLDNLLFAPESPVKWRNKAGRPPGSVKPEAMKYRTIRMTDEEWEYCKSQGNAAEFIRDLISSARK